ncbi:MAG TPA: tetratricopeptide repeat protein [Verrucomicrobiae bacterium]|nr:tetratricopeptide repeat protein [Verrucomicrobiae bacterium]
MLIAFSVCVSALGADASAEFDAANKLFEQGKFKDAASAYEKMLASGAQSPALYFNLGNARFKAGEVGRAVAAYRRALQIAPRDPDVRANLEFIRNQVQSPTLPPGPWQSWFEKLTLNEWTVLTFAAFWVFLILLILMQLRPALRKPLRIFAVLSAVTTVLLACCLGAVISMRSTKIAIVTVDNVSVRNSPFEESQSAFTAHDGAELRVLDSKNGWLQVSAGNRRIGWLKREQTVLF